jgi:hypothetical protein
MASRPGCPRRLRWMEAWRRLSRPIGAYRLGTQRTCRTLVAIDLPSTGGSPGRPATAEEGWSRSPLPSPTSSGSTWTHRCLVRRCARAGVGPPGPKRTRHLVLAAPRPGCSRSARSPASSSSSAALLVPGARQTDHRRHLWRPEPHGSLRSPGAYGAVRRAERHGFTSGGSGPSSGGQQHPVAAMPGCAHRGGQRRRPHHPPWPTAGFWPASSLAHAFT